MGRNLVVTLILTALAGCATPAGPANPVGGASPLASPSAGGPEAPLVATPATGAATSAPIQAAGSAAPASAPPVGSSPAVSTAPVRTNAPSAGPTAGATAAPTEAPSVAPRPTATPEAPAPASLVLVEGGKFVLDGGRAVSLDSFYMGAHEVTQAEYASVMGANPSLFPGDDRPVEQVNWWDAIKYCNARSRAEGLPAAYHEATGELLNADGRFMFTPNNFVSAPTDPAYPLPYMLYDFSLDPSRLKGYRLPTNSEWQFAASGGTQPKGYRYPGGDNVADVAVYLDNANGQTAPVGSKAPNELGLYDMSGNVWEWVGEILSPVTKPDQINFATAYRSQQAYNPYSTGRMYNTVFFRSGGVDWPSSWTAWPSRRGGSWGNGPEDVKATTTLSSNPDYGHRTVGFRVVRYP